MFKWLADVTTLTEKDMSATSLKRLQVFTFLSIPLFPLLVIYHLNLLPDFVPGWSVGLGIAVAAIGFVVLGSSRVANRVWVRDQYLDEWELRIKHRSMAFGFQVIMWTIAGCVILFIIFDDMWDVIRINLSTIGLLYGLGAISILGIYSQLLAQLAMIQPMDEDELNSTAPGRRSLKVPTLATIFGFALLILLPFTLGVMSGYKSARVVTTLGDEAKSVCEARGSRVHWVSSADGGDYACFDENRPAPENESEKESE